MDDMIKSATISAKAALKAAELNAKAVFGAAVLMAVSGFVGAIYQVDKSAEEIMGLKSQVSTLQLDKNNLTASTSRLGEEVKNCKNQIATQKNEINDIRTKNVMCSNKLNEAKDSLIRSQKDLEAANRENNNLIRTNQELLEKMTRYREVESAFDEMEIILQQLIDISKDYSDDDSLAQREQYNKLVRDHLGAIVEYQKKYVRVSRFFNGPKSRFLNVLNEGRIIQPSAILQQLEFFANSTKTDRIQLKNELKDLEIAGSRLRFLAPK